MATFKNKISVFLTDLGAQELRGVFKLWLKESQSGGYAINCNSVDPNGPYFTMTLQLQLSESEKIDFEAQVPHAYIKAVVSAPDLKKLGFV